MDTFCTWVQIVGWWFILHVNVAQNYPNFTTAFLGQSKSCEFTNFFSAFFFSSQTEDVWDAIEMLLQNWKNVSIQMDSRSHWSVYLHAFQKAYICYQAKQTPKFSHCHLFIYKSFFSLSLSATKYTCRYTTTEKSELVSFHREAESPREQESQSQSENRNCYMPPRSNSFISIKCAHR